MILKMKSLIFLFGLTRSSCSWLLASERIFICKKVHQKSEVTNRAQSTFASNAPKQSFGSLTSWKRIATKYLSKFEMEFVRLCAVVLSINSFLLVTSNQEETQNNNGNDNPELSFGTFQQVIIASSWEHISLFSMISSRERSRADWWGSVPSMLESSRRTLVTTSAWTANPLARVDTRRDCPAPASRNSATAAVKNLPENEK